MIQHSKKRFFIISLSFLALFVTSWLELYLQRKQHLIGAGLNRASLFLLINVHVIAIIILLAVIIRQSIKLFIERHKDLPGSIFKRNLLFAFTLFSVIPSFFIFFTAGKFITTSIDDWFHARIGTGLNNSIVLHQTHTKTQRQELQKLGALIIQQIQKHEFDQSHDRLKQIIDKLFPQPTPYTLYVWDKDHQQLSQAIKEEISVWRNYRRFNDRSMKSLKQKFLTIINNSTNQPELFDFYGSLYWVYAAHDFFIILASRYPEEIRYPLIEILNSAADYQQLKSMRNPIYINYIFTFILVTLLILFLSIWCAFYLARGISTPIQELLKATDKMRKGNFDVHVTYDDTSDLKSLAIGFNEMSKALNQAYHHLESKNKELDAIIEHLTVAVFFVNKFGRIITYNAAAKELIAYYLSIERFKNKKINFFGSFVHKHFFSLAHELKASKKSKLSKELTFSFKGESRTLMIHAAIIPIATGINMFEYRILIAVEDISTIVKANKLKTWQEAAKQMAHEIKNPLTPIQLATQRLQRKYSTILSHDQPFLSCTNTILSHVKIIQDLATHFYEFAAMPAPYVEPTDLNQLLQETISLYELSYPHIAFILELAQLPTPLLTDKKKLKRVVINLLDNSIRAINQSIDRKDSQQKFIKIETKINSDTAQKNLTIIIADNGPGITKSVKDTLFLPYVSTEKKNMGLGLAIVHDIVTQLQGTIALIHSDHGATFMIVLPLLQAKDENLLKNN